MVRFYYITALFLLIPLLAMAVGESGQYKWSVQLRGYISKETGKEPNAYLWLPENIDTVKAVVMAQQNMTEETLFKMPAFKREMERLKVGLLWIAPHFTHTWDPASGCQSVFEEMMTAIAFQSGHPEIAHCPVVPFGHSAQATFPWNFAAWNNNRTLCIVSFHGDAPRTNLTGFGTANVEWGRSRNIDGIPGLMVEGEYEWWEARVNPALAFRMMYPDACVSFLCDTGRGHFDCSEETALYIARFIEKSMHYRLKAEGLVKLNPREGWLAERWHENQAKRAAAAPYDKYKGDSHDAFWYFDREMAELTEKRYARDRKLQPQTVSVEYEGQEVAFDKKYQGGMQIRLPQGVRTFKLKALPENAYVEVICGPVEKMEGKDANGYETFRLVDYECGLDNPKRSYVAWVCAVNPSDGKHKSAVQPIEVRIAH